MCFLLKLLVLVFLYNIHVNQNKSICIDKNYLVFIIHQVSKHGVSRYWFTKEWCIKNNYRDNQDRIRINHIGIAKCNLFFQYRDSKEILFYYFRNTKLCAKHKKHMNSIYIVGIVFVK